VKLKTGKYIDSDRTFFCSELIAKMYKVLGVLEGDKPSVKFMPGDFSAKASDPLPLSPNSVLGPDLFIKPNPLTAAELKVLEIEKLKAQEQNSKN
jgi:hypothetical protein